jgi:hypothetical protein
MGCSCILPTSKVKSTRTSRHPLARLSLLSETAHKNCSRHFSVRRPNFARTDRSLRRQRRLLCRWNSRSSGGLACDDDSSCSHHLAAPFVWAQRRSSACSLAPTSGRFRQRRSLGGCVSAVGARRRDRRRNGRERHCQRTSHGSSQGRRALDRRWCCGRQPRSGCDSHSQPMIFICRPLTRA